jgi:hypothetical protein
LSFCVGAGSAGGRAGFPIRKVGPKREFRHCLVQASAGLGVHAHAVHVHVGRDVDEISRYA